MSHLLLYGTVKLFGDNAYGKAPMMLSMLGGIVGDSAVQRAMSEYAKAWRFKHPSPWDYMFFMSRALGRDLGILDFDRGVKLAGSRSYVVRGAGAQLY